MKTLIFSLLVVLLVSSPYVNATDKQNQAVIEIDAEDSAGPWGKSDGSGCGNKIVTAAFKAADVNIKQRILPYSRCKLEVINGSIPACYSMSLSSELSGKVVFSALPLYVVHAEIISTDDNKFGIKHISKNDDIPGDAAIGIVNGYEYPQDIVKILSQKSKIYLLDSEATILLMLKERRLDFGILMVDKLKTLAYVKKEAGMQDNRSFISIFESGKQPSHIGFSIADPLGIKLKEKFDSGYRKITYSGEKEKILSACQKGVL